MLPIQILEIVGLFFLGIWLAIETAWDLWKSVVLPLWLVIPPLVAGVVFQLLLGHEWLAAGAAAGIIIHLSNRIWIRVVGTTILIAAALMYGLVWLAIGFGLYWILWEGNIMGGADALAVYSVFLFFPNQEAFWFVLAGIFLWALAYMVFSYRAKLAARVQQMFTRLYLKNLPSEEELATEGKPTIGGVWLSVLFYAAWHILGAR